MSNALLCVRILEEVLPWIIDIIEQDRREYFEAWNLRQTWRVHYLKTYHLKGEVKDVEN